MDGQVREMFQVDLGLDDEKATTRARGTEGGNEADEQSRALSQSHWDSEKKRR